VNSQIFLVASAGVKHTEVVQNQIEARGRTLKLSRYFPRNALIILTGVLVYNAEIKASMFQRVLNGEANYGRQILAVSSINQKEVDCTEPQHTIVSLHCIYVTFTTLLKFPLYTISHFLLRAGKMQ
jgi:hypothetical protein